MGVRDLWKLVEGASETWSLRTLTIREGFEGARPERLYYLGIDVSMWMQAMMHKFSTGHAQSGEQPELCALYYRLAMLAERPIHAVFVVDGPQRPAYKRGKKVRTPPLWLTNGLRRLVEAFGFAWLEAAGEAEAELARMSSLGLIDAVMTDDSDTLIFGAAVIIRNPSFKRTGSDEVKVYRTSRVLEKTGLSPDDLFFYGLLVGCDYDKDGLRNCGPRVAAGLIRYGLGRALRRALDTYDDQELVTYLQGWREQLRDRLRDDPLKHIGRKSLKLAANFPATFPKIQAARCLGSPAVLSPSVYDTVLQPQSINFSKLGATCELFFGWGNAAEIIKTFRSTLWSDEVTRMLVSEGLTREGISSTVGRARSLLELSFKAVGNTPAFGYAMCRLEVTDNGLSDEAREALQGLRPYPLTATTSEEEVFRKSKEPLIIRVPALILERARPWLITPAYKTEGYNYGRVDGVRRSRDDVNTASSSSSTKHATPAKKMRPPQGRAGVQDAADMSSALDSSCCSPSLHAGSSSSCDCASMPSSRATATTPSSATMPSSRATATTPTSATMPSSRATATTPSSRATATTPSATTPSSCASMSASSSRATATSPTLCSTSSQSSLHASPSASSPRASATSSSLCSTSSRSSGTSSRSSGTLSRSSSRTVMPASTFQIPHVLEDVIIDLTIPETRPRRARQLAIYNTDDIIDLTVD
ncbi:hypothetical protein C8T65DRAFT_649005 [Cerioporus squamosus]|nr:hypothetical protein C8T65DRAFT_676737 [Cerioporus squamosus]KAI0709528.1 hypothetical protein C8T65DRAFT_649005 [Cerioporus squamosus]